MKFHKLTTIIASASLAFALANCKKSDDKATDKKAETPKIEVPKTEAPKAAAPTASAPVAPVTPVAAAPSAGGAAAAITAAEKAAIEKFKAELLAAKADIDPLKKAGDEAAKENPMASLVPLKAMCKRIGEVKTDGLPADLKEAWGGMTATMAKMGALVKDFPDKPGDMVGWITKNVGTDPAAVEKWGAEFQGKLMGAMAGGDAAQKNFEAAAAKYGIDMGFMK